MKKTLALVLALAMVFSTITVAFAEDTLGADAQVCADLGMLKGETGTVDAAYVATAPTRLQAAVMFLRLKGLEAEALAFTGTESFADADTVAWAGGKAIMAYLKANPQLGWIGDGVSFNPSGAMTAQAYYKVMLETLGYKQTTAEVVGDFTYEEVLTFAAGVGLSKVAAVTNFTVNDLATATVEALKLNVKGTEAPLYASLVTEDAAVAAGLVEAAAPVVAVAVDEVTAIGNAVVEVEFEEDVDAAAAANIDNYAIEGLVINAVVVTGTDTVRLETAAMTAGTLYKLTVGEDSVQFAGIAKVSGGPEIVDVVSNDVEEVVIEFTKTLDYAVATDVANYTIAGITVVEAEVDGDEVTLTTEGLKDDTSYTVKVINMKSVDLVTKKTDSDTFKSNFDTVAPKVLGDVEVETNQRIIVTFNEDVTEESAEDLANYAIKVNETDGAELGIVSVEWDEDDENFVEIVTEAMEDNEEYKLSVSNIADECKTPNVMSRPAVEYFEGVDEDEDEPELTDITVMSSTKFVVTFEDDSRMDEASILDVSNYVLECEDEELAIEDIATLDDETGLFRAVFTVEEMETNGDCNLEVIDILDEFGNALEDESNPFDATLASFESAALVAAVATGENTVVLDFGTDELDEESAENIANYSIDGGIGAPTEAVYELADYDDDDVDEYIVTLTVGDLVNGTTATTDYDLTIDGVMDLAGNELLINVVIDTDEVAFEWDEDVPVLEDVESVNKFVVALEFDEEVAYVDGVATVELISDYDGDDVDEDPDYTEDTPLELLAYADTDDGTVVEFSDYDDELVEGVTYYVYNVTSIADLIGNVFVFTFDEDDLVDFDGVDEDVEFVEVDSVEQINGGQFEVTMTGNVAFAAGVDGDTDMDGLTAAIDDNVITFTGSIEEEDEFDINFSDYFVDEHGFIVVDEDDVVEDYDVVEDVATDDTEDFVTTLTGEETDLDKPYVEDVVATSRTTVEIEFSEFIEAVDIDDYAITNVDLDRSIDIDSIEIDDNVVTLTLDDALEGRYEYELTFSAGCATDYATNTADDDTFVFDGSDLAQD